MNAQILSGVVVGFVYMLLVSVVGLDSIMGAYLYGSGMGLLTVVIALLVKHVIDNRMLRFISIGSIFALSGFIVTTNEALIGDVSFLHNVFYISAMGSYLVLLSVFSRKEKIRGSRSNNQDPAEISNFG